MEMYGNSADDGDDSDHVISSLLGENSSSTADALENHDNATVKQADNVSNIPPQGAPVEDDASQHPGILIAMNAAAMDGGLGALGSTEFVPVAAHSLPTYPPPPTSAPPKSKVMAPQAPAPARVNVPVAPKRPYAVPSNTAVDAAAKKRKGVTVASSGGVPAAMHTVPVGGPKPVLPATLAAAAAAAVSQAKAGVKVTASVPPSISLPKGPPVPAPKSSVIAPIMPRPAPVPSAVVSSSRVIPHQVTSLTAAAKAGGLIPKPHVTTNLPDGPTLPKRAQSEADFKDVAQAAVTSLIQSASSGVPGLKPTVPPPVKPAGTKAGIENVDTSTAHINALTSQNWVNACNPAPPPLEAAPPSASACDKAARNARRATLSQEERAKQNRDRNREHARNTRLRKKAYVEELKRTLTEIVAQRDAADLEKRHSAQREREQREVRFRVMEEFLKLRGRNELNSARWVAILEDGFTFTLPKTPYRQMVKLDATKGVSESDLEQVLHGATSAMEDSQYLSALLQTIGGNAAAGPQIQIVYRCDRKRFFMDGTITFMDFSATTIGAKNRGAENEIVFKGSMRASFSPASNKLISVEISFDTGCVTRQLEHLNSTLSAEAASVVAAAAAAHDADALLDSLQVPQIYGEQNISAAAARSVSSDDGAGSSDDSTGQS